MDSDKAVITATPAGGKVCALQDIANKDINEMEIDDYKDT